jgi:hypothetical protein
LSNVIFPDGPEIPLEGGDVTEGLVRIGDTVRRPRGQGAALVESLLTYLERQGFAGAPRFLGIDDSGRQVLSYVAGEVAGRPWPAWMKDDERIVSVAELVRAYDDAAHGFGIPAGIPPRPEIAGAPPSRAGAPTFVAHMDITPENVVFVDGRAAALIDFDLARPADRALEVSNLLLWWAPLMPPEDREDAVRDVDAVRRARLLVDAYGLDGAGRAQLVDLSINGAERGWFAMRERAERLGGGWRRMWDEGVGDRIHRRHRWLLDNAAALDEAVRG